MKTFRVAFGYTDSAYVHWMECETTEQALDAGVHFTAVVAQDAGAAEWEVMKEEGADWAEAY